MRPIFSTMLSVIFTIAIMPALISSAWAQDDQVIVIDDLTRPQLNAEIEKIESELYRVWNANNNSDSLDIICSKYTPTGSHRTLRTCEPKFLVDTRGKNASDAQLGLDELLSLEALQAELGKEFAELTAGMADLAKRNSGFAELVNILSMLRGRLNELN